MKRQRARPSRSIVIKAGRWERQICIVHKHADAHMSFVEDIDLERGVIIFVIFSIREAEMSGRVNGCARLGSHDDSRSTKRDDFRVVVDQVNGRHNSLIQPVCIGRYWTKRIPNSERSIQYTSTATFQLLTAPPPWEWPPSTSGHPPSQLAMHASKLALPTQI